MAPPVYSLRIFSGPISSTTGPVGPIVPAEFVYVVRDLDAVAQSGAAGDEFALANPTGGLMYLARVGSPATTFVFQWRGRQVYGPGEQVLLDPFQGSFDVCISGYQLTLP